MLFRSHLNGDAHLFTPESTVDVQLALGSDIMMVLDECPAYPVEHEAAAEAMRRTVRWARAGYRSLPRAQGAKPGPRQALFPIVQGSMYRDLRGECAGELTELDADGYAIGGLSVGEPRAMSLEMPEAGAAAAARPAAVRHGRRDARGTARIRGPRRGHDGLRAALAQRPQRLPVHFRRAGSSLNRRDTRTIPARWTRRAAATPAGTSRGPICATFPGR